MNKRTMSENELKRFIKEFEIINSLYRQGKFEESVFYDSKKKTIEVVSSAGAEKISLQTAGNLLYYQVKSLWDASNIPLKDFPKLLRAMTISFEIDEYFLCLSREKKDFFIEFSKSFWNDEPSNFGEHFESKMLEFAKRINNFPQNIDAVKYTELANELMLFNLSGVNALYMQHSVESYELGLSYVNKIFEYIEIILHRKRKDPDSDKTRGQERSALGLKGLAYFFIGRFNYGLGNFQKSEAAFKNSILLYIEKMNRLVPETGSKDAESRTLSLRRANFAEIIGLVNLYLIESRIDDALSILQRVRPLFEFNAGELTLAYCDLLNISVNRAKYSSEEEKLKKLEDYADGVLKIFNKWVPRSHFPQRVNIELSLIYFYRAKSVSSSDIHMRKEFYEKSLRRLDDAITYSNKLTEQGIIRNRRILVEALTIRSHIYRNYADLGNDFFTVQIKKAVTDATNAEQFAKGLKQLESDALIAVGIVYRDMYANKIHEKLSLRSKADKIVPPDAVNLREKSRDYFFKAMDLNTNDNPRISAICYLRLAELEMLSRPSYLRSKFFFDKFKKIRDKVSHQYLLEFATGLERKIEERKGSEFFINPEESLDFNYWKEKLENFLIEQTIFFTALEIKGNLPSRRVRGEKPISSYSSEAKLTNKRETRQSVLAKAFENKIGMAANKAYKVAKTHLTEFERLCEEMLR